MRFQTTLKVVAAALALSVSGLARGEGLDARMAALLGSPLVKGASVGVDIVEVTPRGPVALFSNNATMLLGPASNCKLLTTTAAFEKYGPKAAFKTTLFKVGEDLVLVGGGDPGFGDSKISATAAWGGEGSPTAAFEKWAAGLKQKGIVEFRDLIVDDRVFDTQWVHPNWPADQRLDWYCAPVGGLNFNANCLDWMPKLTNRGVDLEIIPETTYVSVVIKASKGAETKVSLLRPGESNKFELRGTVAASATSPYSVPIYDPGMWTGTILRDVLAKAGVQGRGQVRRVGADVQLPAGVLLASHETPLMAVITRANTNSVNMMAEGLCKRLGHDATGQPGSWVNGPAAVEAYAVSIGAKGEWMSLDDGSGLSKENKVAPRALTTVLAHVGARKDADEFIKTLAVPGEEGTLEKRFKGKKVADHVHAKTGHISGVSALSGYIETDGANPRRFAFSILVNKYQGNVNPWQDDVCEAVYLWATGK